MTEFEIVNGKLVEVHECEWEELDTCRLNYSEKGRGRAAYQRCTKCDRHRTAKYFQYGDPEFIYDKFPEEE